MRLIKLSVMLSVMLGAAVLVGCQATGPALTRATLAAATAPSPPRASCSKCVIRQVQSPVMANPIEVAFYQTQQKMSCPDCRDAMTNLFTRGMLEHSCRTCATEYVSCEAHRQPAATADLSNPAATNLDWPLR